MRSLSELQKDIAELPDEDRAGLASFMLSSLPSPPLGPDDRELESRERDLDSGLEKNDFIR